MKNLITLCIIPAFLFGGGIFVGYNFLKKEKRVEIPMVETIRTYLTNEREILRTVYVPVSGDTTRYTNLYTNTITLYSNASNIMQAVDELTAQIRAPRALIGGGYIAAAVPLSIGGGVEWDHVCITAAVGLATNLTPIIASVNAYYRF